MDDVFEGDLDDYDGDWIYVEDSLTLADELVENQVASPGYAGTNYEIDLDEDEAEWYGYWLDLEYGDDPSLDSAVSKPRRRRQTQDGGQKRKTADGKLEAAPNKRRKVEVEENVRPQFVERYREPVVFRSKAQRTRDFERSAPRPEPRSAYAFMPDWRIRFQGRDGVLLPKSMPLSMKIAAEGRGPMSPSKPMSSKQIQALAGDGDGDEGEDEEADDDAMADADGDLQDLDPSMLEAVLKQKLGDAGLEGMDQAAFMETISKMLSGQGAVDDVAGDLANNLLAKLTEGEGDEALSGWLSHQGVSFEAEGRSSQDREDLETASESKMNGGIGVEDNERESAGNYNYSSEQLVSRKRKPGSAVAESAEKKPRVAFETPPKSSRDVHDANGDDVEVPKDGYDSQTAGADQKSAASNNFHNGDFSLSKGEPETRSADTASASKSRKRKISHVEKSGGPNSTNAEQDEPVKETKVAAEQESGPPAKRTRSAKARSKK